MYFDPFNKSLESVSAADVERLRDVAEGWYVEYKREPIPARNVGKSLSAFANHFGGWLIFGVHAPQRVPEAFPGLDAGQVSAVMQTLRDAARDHVDPVLYFESREVPGPCDPVGLPAGHSVVIVQVMEGRNPPYIHSSGRIYRRVADSSLPEYETDRAVIDLLTQRARETRDWFKERVSRLPEFSEHEKDMPCLQIFLTPDPWGEHTPRHVLKHIEFAAIMGKTDDAAYSMGLENCFPTSWGYIARHTAANDPFNIACTWHFTHDGFSSVVMPIGQLDHATALRYKYGSEFPLSSNRKNSHS